MENILISQIRQTLGQRKAKNPGYSLRAFARQVGVPAPTLSRLLAGHWKLTLPMAKRLVMGLSDLPSERARLLKAFALGAPKAPVKETRYRQLSREELQVMNHWGYSAILELLHKRSRGIRLTSEVQTLTGLSQEETESFLKTLKKLGFVTHSIRQGWKAKKLHLSSVRWEGESAWREIHAGYATLGTKAIRSYDRNACAVTGITFFISKHRLDEARERLREFALELADDLATEEADQLYRLNVQLFPLGN